MSKGAKRVKPGGGGLSGMIRGFLTTGPKKVGSGAASKLINMHKKKK